MPPPKPSLSTPFSYRPRIRLAVLGLAVLAGCARDVRVSESVPPRPAEVRAQIVRLLPPTTPDRPG